MGKFTRKLLETVAQQMNIVMGLDPAIDANAPDDDTLFDTICWEARGRDIVKDAIRADDFVTSNPDKKTFNAETAKFFVDAGLWDAVNKRAIMAAKAPAVEVVEKSAKTTGKKATEPVEEKAQAEMDTDEAEPELPLEQKVEQVKPAVKKQAKVDRKKEPNAKSEQKAAKTAAKTTPATEQAAEEKEEVMATKTATKKGAAKPAAKASKSTATQKTAVAKTAAKKIAPMKTKAAPKGTGVGALCRELIAKYPNKGNTELAEMVRTKLKTETPSASVAWYRNQMKAGKKAKKK